MSFSTSFALDYFVNQLKFSPSDSGSLLVEKQVCKRIIPGITAAEKLNDRYGDEARLAKISQALATELIIVELNFKYVRIIDSLGNSWQQNSKLEELFVDRSFLNLAKKNKYSLDALEQALLTAPVFAYDAQSNLFNLKLLHYITSLLEQKLEVKHSQLVVFSGEMIWSRWINTFMLTQLLQRIFQKQQRSVYIDSYGVWQCLLHNYQQELLQLDEQYFQPNFHYLVDHKVAAKPTIKKLHSVDGDDKELIVMPGRAAIFEISGDYYYSDTKVTGTLYWRAGESELSRQSWRSWWPERKFLQELGIEYQPQPEVAYRTSKFEFSIDDLSSSLQEGEQVLPGSTVGKTHYTPVFFQKIGVEKRNFAASMLEGQFVREGETLYYDNGSILKRAYKAKFSGQVSYEFIDLGFIAFKQTQEEKVLTANFTANVLKRTGAKISFAAEAIHLPIFRMLGAAAHGTLKLDFSDVNLGDIWACNWQEFRSIDSVELIIRGSAGVILTGVDRLEFMDYTQRHTELLTRVNICILNTLASPTPVLDKLLHSFVGAFSMIDDSGINLTLNTQEQKSFFALAREQKGELCGHLALVAKYEQIDEYARIENVTSSSIVINAQHINLANLLYYG